MFNNTGRTFPSTANPLDNLSDKAKQTLAGHVSSDTALRKWKRVRHYLEWCEVSGFLASEVLPAPEWLLCEYAASFAGRVAGPTAQGYLSALKCYHIRKGVAWNGGKNLRDMLQGVERQAPASSRKEERPPVKERYIELLDENLDLSGSNGFHSCVAATAKAMWAGQMRAGEPLGNSADIRSFRADRHPTVAHLSAPSDSGTRRLKLPRTKTEPARGETVILSALPNRQTDPNPALDDHIRVNSLSPSDPLCAFRDSNGNLHLLTKTLFMDTCNAIWSRFDIPRITGHSFRIGSTTHLLLAGVPPDVVKVTGRWKSDSFLRYWRNLDSLASLHIHRLHSQNAYMIRLRRSSQR